MVYSTTEKDSKQKQTDSPNGSREDTPLFGEDQLSLGITEEKVKDMPGGGLYTVHGRDMHMSFCPVDRLYFRSNNLGCFFTILISDMFCRAIDQVNVAVADS